MTEILKHYMSKSNLPVSVVISTRKINDDYLKHVEKMFSHPKTQILIYENDGVSSLAEIYNDGLKDSQYNIVVFMHDDLIIETKSVGEKIRRIFDKNPEFGVIGIAGTTDLINGRWWELKKSMIGRVYHQQDGNRWLSKYSNDSLNEKPKEVVCVDGLFFAVHKDRIKTNFDEEFKGFHFYEVPFCLNNHLQGVKIGVTTKFDIVHKSIGQTNQQWEDNKIQFEEKFKDVLPIRMTNNKTFDEKLNYDKDKIGLGIVTYNAEHRIVQSAPTVPSWVKHFVIVNDGTPYNEESYPKNAHIIQHETNKSVGQAKNTAIQYLMEQGCDHIFIMEDDVLIKSDEVFDKYIKTSVLTGIKHLNYALQGPANKKGAEGFQTLEDRAKQNGLTEPNPRQVVTYPDGVEVALYPNSVGSFSYYNREVIEKIGLFDSTYKNAWEHVDHTLQAFKNGFTTPYWWFADINKSWEYIDDIPDSIENSTIARSETWQKNYRIGFEHFKKKHKFGPTEIPDLEPNKVSQVLNNLYQLR